MPKSCNYENSVLLIALAFAACAFPELAQARDLASAANSAVNQATTIAKAISVLGIVSGGILYNIPGAADLGKRTAIGGAVGCALTFGGQSFMGLMQTVFGQG